MPEISRFLGIVISMLFNEHISPKTIEPLE